MRFDCIVIKLVHLPGLAVILLKLKADIVARKPRLAIATFPLVRRPVSPPKLAQSVDEGNVYVDAV